VNSEEQLDLFSWQPPPPPPLDPKVQKKLAARIRKTIPNKEEAIDSYKGDRLANTARRARMASEAWAHGEYLQRQLDLDLAIMGRAERGEATHEDLMFANRALRAELGGAAYWSRPHWTWIKDTLEMEGVDPRDRERFRKYWKLGDNVHRPNIPTEVLAEIVKIGEAATGRDWDLKQLKDVLRGRRRFEKAGAKSQADVDRLSRQYEAWRDAILTPPSAEDEHKKQIREAERALVGRKIPGFFPTPTPLGRRMVKMAEIEPGMRVLEPSAGKGDLADAIREVSGVDPDVIEPVSDLRTILEAKGHHLVGRDFLDLHLRGFTWGDTFRDPEGREGRLAMTPGGGMGSERAALKDADGRMIGYYNRDQLTPVHRNGSDSGYDRIVMNPPFEKGQDVKHVLHAYSLLKPGGRVVAIMGAGVSFRQDKLYRDFRQTLRALGGTMEKLPPGSFKASGTGVNAVVVTLDKPEAKQSLTEMVDDAIRSSGRDPHLDHAAKLRREADRLSKQAIALMDRIPAGQPVRSTRDRNLRERSAALTRRAGDLMERAER